jgi:hypothetical protein
MKKFIIKNKITLLALVLLAFGGIFFLTSSKIAQKNQDMVVPSVRDTTETAKTAAAVTPAKEATLEINGKQYKAEITEETSVYDFMKKLKDEGKISFTEKYYVGMGKFIDSIDGISGNGSQNWIYYVNGQKALIGVSNYKINPGDVVSWKYEKNY